MAHWRPRPTWLGALTVVLLALAMTTACTSAGPEHAAVAPAPHPAAAATPPGTVEPTPGTTGSALAEVKCSYRPSTAVLPT